jgi:hypothetical protein
MQQDAKIGAPPESRASAMSSAQARAADFRRPRDVIAAESSASLSVPAIGVRRPGRGMLRSSAPAIRPGGAGKSRRLGIVLIDAISIRSYMSAADLPDGEVSRSHAVRNIDRSESLGGRNMIRGSRSRTWPPLLAAAVLLSLLPAGGSILSASPKPPEAARQTAQLTSEPQPPLELKVGLGELQKNRRGGIATLRIDLSASVAVAGAVLTVKAPAPLVFADGSTVKTWNLDLAASHAGSIPVDVIASQDGKYAITAEIEGTVDGRPVRRGAAYKLLVGVKEKEHRIKDGAIEFTAAEEPQP